MGGGLVQKEAQGRAAADLASEELGDFPRLSWRKEDPRD